MKIGIVTTWFERGAAYVSKQYRDSLRDQHEVFIYARGGEHYATDDSAWNTVDVTWGKRTSSTIPTFICLQDFERWVRSNSIDLVFFNEQWWWPAVEHANKLGVVTGAYVDYYTEQTIPLFQAYDFLICNTQRHLSAFNWHPAAYFIPWGTNVDLFSPRPKDAPVDRPLVFFHSAGISPRRKGTDLLLQAFDRTSGSARLFVHIQRDLRSALPEHTELIDRLQARGVLSTHEVTVAAPGLFHRGDVYVYPTRLEGIGLTIMEAAACGLPVIVTDEAPMNEFIEHGVNGRLVAVEKRTCRSDAYYWPQACVCVDSLREQMQWYIDHREQLPACQGAARARALQRFDWKQTQSDLLSAFESAAKLIKPDKSATSSAIEAYTAYQRSCHRPPLSQWLASELEMRYPRAHGVLKQLRNLARRRTLK